MLTALAKACGLSVRYELLKSDNKYNQIREIKQEQSQAHLL